MSKAFETLIVDACGRLVFFLYLFGVSVWFPQRGVFVSSSDLDCPWIPVVLRALLLPLSLGSTATYTRTGSRSDFPMNTLHSTKFLIDDSKKAWAIELGLALFVARSLLRPTRPTSVPCGTLP